MIVHDLDIVRVSACPTEAESPLVIDPDAVLTCAISQQFLKPIRRWDHQISSVVAASRILSFRRAVRCRSGENRGTLSRWNSFSASLLRKLRITQMIVTLLVIIGNVGI